MIALWQACLDLEPFTGNQYVPGAMFSLTSAPVMFHLESDSSLLKEIDKGLESVQNVDYAKVHELTLTYSNQPYSRTPGIRIVLRKNICV